MTKYLNFFESESGFTEAVEAGQLFYPNVSYTEDDDTVHWKAQSADPVETPMLRMSFSTSSPGQEVGLGNCFTGLVTAMEIDGTPVNYTSGGTYSVASPGNHTAVYQFAGSQVPSSMFRSFSGEFDTFTSAEITSAVTSIGIDAFRECGGLSGVSMPDSVTAIGHGAFAECSGLTSVAIPDSVTSLGEHVFKDCTEMRSARIGSGITTIPFQTFSGCTSLQSVTLPDSLTDIDHGAFANCSSLYDINIPSGVTRIGLQAFLGCSGLTAIYFNSETPLSLGANALDYTNDCPIYVPAASVETYQQAWPAYASRIRPMGGGQYNITAEVNDDSLGEVILDQQTAAEGETVGFSVNVFDPVSSEVMVIQIHDENFNEVQYTDEGEGNYSFTMPASDVNVSVFIIGTGRHRITVNVNDDSLGEVNIGQEAASEGEPVSFSVDVYDGDSNQVSSVTVTDGNGNEVQVNDEGSNHYSFDMPGSDVTISVVIGEKPKYNITATVNNEDLGQVNLDGETASEGDHVEFDVMVFDSEQNQVSSVTVTDGNGNEVQCTNEFGNHYSFTMPDSDVTISVVIGEKPKTMHTVTVNSTDDLVTGAYPINEETGDWDWDYEGELSFLEGEPVDFAFRVPEGYQAVSAEASDCDGNIVDEVFLDDVYNSDGPYAYGCHFTMPGCNTSVFITIEEKQ